MSTNTPSDATVAFYDAHAEQYVRDTIGIRMEDLYEPFLALVPAGGHILDAGCGSGRDALDFKQKGYLVTAIDASPEMARFASVTIGHSVRVMRFQELDEEETFDGIWACASLLHIPHAEMNDVFARFTRALRTGGAWYMSFKMGNAEEVLGGRFFSDYTSERLSQLILRHPQLRIHRLWQTQDVRGERLWVNALVQKIPL
jgi:SAM-dependent methyltransferase